MRWKIAQRLELRWWKRYLRNRNLEEYLSWKKAYWQDFVAQLNLPKIEGRTLDAGCGPAGVFMILNEADVTAIDPLLEKYENDLNLPSEEYKERITFKPLGIEDYFMIEHFDFIFCLNAINHVKDMSKALHNLGESLKPGGRMIVSRAFGTRAKGARNITTIILMRVRCTGWISAHVSRFHRIR